MKSLWVGVKLDFKRMKANTLRLLVFSIQMVILCMAIGIAGSHILYADKNVQPFVLAIVDKEDSEWTHMIIDTIKQMETVTELCEIQMMGEEEAIKKLSRDEVMAIATIPEHFVHDVIVGINTPLTIQKKDSTMIESVVIDKLIVAGVKLLSAAQAGIYSTLDCYELYGTDEGASYNVLMQEINLIFAKKMLARNRMFEVEEVRATGAITTLEHYILSGFIVMMMLSLMLVMNIIEPLNEREMLMRYSVSKIKGRYLVIQKLISLSVFNMVLGGAILGGVMLLTQYSHLPISWQGSWQGLLGGILGAIGLASMGLFIGLLLKGKETYSLFIFLITMIQAFLSGGIVPSAFLPDFMTRLGRFTYNEYAIKLLGNMLEAICEPIFYIGMLIMVMLSMFGSLIVLKKRGLSL